MDQYNEVIAKITALEVKLKFSEDLINKLMRIVIEGNGKPSIQTQQLMLQQEVNNIKDLFNKEYSLIKKSLEDLESSLDKKDYYQQAIKVESRSPSDGDEEDNDNKGNNVTIILAIITSVTTLLGMVVTTLPSILPSFIGRQEEPLSIVYPSFSTVIDKPETILVLNQDDKNRNNKKKEFISEEYDEVKYNRYI